MAGVNCILSLSDMIKIAKTERMDILAIPEYKFTTYREREMRKIALENKKGYWVKSYNEMRNEIGEIFDFHVSAVDNPDRKRIWMVWGAIIFDTEAKLFWLSF